MKWKFILIFAAVLEILGVMVMANNFVSVKDGHFVLDNQPFYFAGTNNYYLDYASTPMINNVLENASKMGLKVIRCWGFVNGTESNGVVIQPSLGVYNPNGLDTLDYTIMRADQLGLKLIIVLSNNWDDFGGMNWYVQQAGLKNHEDFYTNSNVISKFEDYIKFVLDHKNIYTGIQYKDDPTIMGWEVANEPRNEGNSPEIITKWAEQITNFIRSIDPNHLIGIGDEGWFDVKGSSNWAYNGYEGLDWNSLLKLPNVDFGTYHLYPGSWGWIDHPVETGLKWIKDHILAAKSLGKPAILEEFGMTNDRDYAYYRWTQQIYEDGGDGWMFWILTGINTMGATPVNGEYPLYPNYDGFRVVYPSLTATLLSDQAAEMNYLDGQRPSFEPVVFFKNPQESEIVNGNVMIEVMPLTYGQKIKSVEFVSGGGTITLSSTYNGIYEGIWDTKKIKDGIYSIKTIATLDNNATLSDEINVQIRNAEARIVLGKTFKFAQGLSDWWNGGTYQANFLSPAFEYSDLLDGSIQMNVEWPGKNNWEEVRIGTTVGDLIDYARVSYDLYVPLDGLKFDDNSQISLYAVLNPGWIKLNINSYKISQMPVVEINGTKYLKFSISDDFPQNVSNANQLIIGVAGGYLPYSGPVYINNVQLYKKVY